MNGEITVTERPFGLKITIFIYTTDTAIDALTYTKHCSLYFKNYSVEIILFLYIHFFGLGPDAARTQYLIQTAPACSTFTLSWNTRPMLRRSTTCPVTCEHKNRSLVNTRIPRYPSAVSLWVAPSPSAHRLSGERLHRHPLSHWDMATSPSAGRLMYRCTIARSPQGEPPRLKPRV
jgi:hypothetical protein